MARKAKEVEKQETEKKPEPANQSDTPEKGIPENFDEYWSKR